MTVFGYINGQLGTSETEQLNRLLGERDYDRLVVESDSLKTPSEWEKLEADLKLNDVVVIFNLQTLGTSLTKLGRRLERLAESQVRLISLEEGLDTSEPISFYETTELILTTERERRKTRMNVAISQHEGLWGRPTIDQEVIDCIQSLAKENNYSIRGIAMRCQVSVGTAHKYVTEYKKDDGMETKAHS